MMNDDYALAGSEGGLHTCWCGMEKEIWEEEEEQRGKIRSVPHSRYQLKVAVQ